ncbi:MAG: hypothetical protein SNI70_10780 [Rikenellaceae bacterium]
MCKYCETQKIIPVHEQPYLEQRIQIVPIKGLWELRIFDYWAYPQISEERCNINYCPMCGRKLKEVTDEN